MLLPSENRVCCSKWEAAAVHQLPMSPQSKEHMLRMIWRLSRWVCVALSASWETVLPMDGQTKSRRICLKTGLNHASRVPFGPDSSQAHVDGAVFSDCCCLCTLLPTRRLQQQQRMASSSSRSSPLQSRLQSWSGLCSRLSSKREAAAVSSCSLQTRCVRVLVSSSSSSSLAAELQPLQCTAVNRAWLPCPMNHVTSASRGTPRMPPITHLCSHLLAACAGRAAAKHTEDGSRRRRQRGRVCI
jgi:hypothetical protein